MSHDSTTAPAGRRLRRVGLWCAVLGLMLALGVSVVSLVFDPPVYSAETWLQIEPTAAELADPKFDARGFAKRQVELIKSPPAILDVLAKSEIANLPIFEDVDDRVAFLRRQIRVGRQGSTSLYIISMRSESRESVAPIVNAAREAYLSLLNSRQTDEEQKLLVCLEQERLDKAAEIKRLEERISRLNTNDSALTSETFREDLVRRKEEAERIADRITVMETGGGTPVTNVTVLSPAETPRAPANRYAFDRLLRRVVSFFQRLF